VEESLLSQLCGGSEVERGNPERPFFANDLNRRDFRRARAICTQVGIKEQALLDACTLDAAVLGDKAAARVFVRATPPRAVLRLGP
jgi:hypothetical protein